jgi:hypothetical protein
MWANAGTFLYRYLCHITFSIDWCNQRSAGMWLP